MSNKKTVIDDAEVATAIRVYKSLAWLFENATRIEYTAREAGTGMLKVTIKETSFEIMSTKQMLSREKMPGESVYNNPKHFIAGALINQVEWLKEVCKE